MPDARRYAPSTARNRTVVVGALERLLGEGASVLEIASGAGEHGVAVCEAAPSVTWWPSDFDPDALASIDAWRAYSGLTNLRAATRIDVTQENWFEETPAPFDALFCANMIHIAPWAASVGLFSGASRSLKPGGNLILYGPFMRDGEQTAPSNAEFDLSLKTRNPEWGIRDLEKELVPLAKEKGLGLKEVNPVPANNFILVFEKTDSDA